MFEDTCFVGDGQCVVCDPVTMNCVYAHISLSVEVNVYQRLLSLLPSVSLFVSAQVLSIPDNDQLSAQVALAMRADLLIMLSDVDGIYSGHPSEPGSRLIHTYYPEHSTAVKFWGKSRVGRGGMESKVSML